MNANIIARITNVNNTLATNNPSTKETTNMNPFTSLIRRAAQVLGLAALLSLSHAAVKADVVVDDWVVPSRVLNVPTGTTELQLKLYNDDNYSVSGAKVNITFWLGVRVDGINFPIIGSQTLVTSRPVNMAPYEDLWVSVTIPRTAPDGLPYFNKMIFATIQSGANSFTIGFQDVAPSANLQIGKITPPANDKPGTRFYVQVSNNGYAASTAQTMTVSLWADAEGRVSPIYTQKVTVLALQPGQSYTATLVMPTIVPYNNSGYSGIKGTATIGSQTVNLSF